MGPMVRPNGIPSKPICRSERSLWAPSWVRKVRQCSGIGGRGCAGCGTASRLVGSMRFLALSSSRSIVNFSNYIAQRHALAKLVVEPMVGTRLVHHLAGAVEISERSEHGGMPGVERELIDPSFACPRLG